jgi:hypothetical protein
VSLWLAVARAEATDETVVRVAAVLAVTTAVDDRLAAAGIAGMTGALDLHRRLAAVLAAVDRERMAALRRIVTTLECDLRQAAQVLARLRELKEAFESLPDDPRPRPDLAR